LFTKKMIALLVLATMLVTGAALAGDGFKMYGKLHTSIDYMSDTEDSQIMMANNTSRFGVKGTKELEENLSLIWQFESAINLAQKGDDTLVTRNSFLGMTGTWGTFLYGIHDTPFKTVGRKATFFYDELGDHRQMTMGWDQRHQDIVMYSTPDFSGFSAVLGFQLDQGEVGAEKSDTAFSGSAAYKKDALYAGVAYETYNSRYSDTIANGDAMTYGDAATGIRLGVKYDFGSLAVAGLFQTLSGQYATMDANDNDIFMDNTATTWGLEAKYAFNEKYAVKGAYYMANPNTDAEDVAGTDVDESAVDYSLLTLGIDRQLGEKTYMYLQYAMKMNGDYSSEGLGGPGHGSSIDSPVDADGNTMMGESPTGISWGVATKF
jgi:predicted porin